MRLRRKLIISVLGLAIALFLVPIIWSALCQPSYFCEGRCACGNDIFVRIQGDGYFRYSPGHGVPEHRAFRLRAREGGWEILGLSHSDLFWSPLEGEDKVIGRVHYQGNALYESWGGSANWMRLPRVYNVWRVWAAKLLKQ
jgi:hypothetical protein